MRFLFALRSCMYLLISARSWCYQLLRYSFIFSSLQCPAVPGCKNPPTFWRLPGRTLKPSAPKIIWNRVLLKSRKMIPRNAPKVILETRQAQRSDFGTRAELFRDILAPFGRFWAPFGPQLGAKGVPKSNLIPEM